MKKLLYVVSTLERSGPTNQLFNLINNLDRHRFSPYLVTLSPDPADSRWKDYYDIGVNLYSLNLSRFKGLFSAESSLNKIIMDIQPDLIHTQGIRADSIIARMNLTVPHVATIRNFAPEDYIAKFGVLKGSVMVRQHFKMMRNAKFLIACSKTISRKLHGVGIDSTPIQNGVDIELSGSGSLGVIKKLPRPVFVSVGSLIKRKNMEFLVDSFNKRGSRGKGSLVILGDGVLMGELKAKAGSGVHLVGNVANVPDYLAAADFFVSTSLSEGLPNTVLEALAAGVPAILSDIESHVEIFNESEKACRLVKIDDDGKSLISVLDNPASYFVEDSRKEAKRVSNDIFSAQNMSRQYQDYYTRILASNE